LSSHLCLEFRRERAQRHGLLGEEIAQVPECDLVAQHQLVAARHDRVAALGMPVEPSEELVVVHRFQNGNGSAA
jgi:hypothetical protein